MQVYAQDGGVTIAMIFEVLYEATKRGELLLVAGGMCHWHLRRDGQLTILEIMVTNPGQGIGTRMLETLTRVPGARSIYAKCPAELDANAWYERRGRRLN